METARTRTGSPGRRADAGPDRFYLVGGDLRISSQNGDVLQLRLGDENAIKGVLVMIRKRGDSKSMDMLDRKRRHCLGRYPSGNVPIWRLRQSEFAYGMLDCYLPGACRREVNCVLSVRDELSR